MNDRSPRGASGPRSEPGAYRIPWDWQPIETPSAFYDSMVGALLRNVPRGARVLEVGVGTGYMLSQLALRADCRCVGIDRLAGSMAVSRETARRAGSAVSLVQGSGFELPFLDGLFDVVTSLGVIEHFSPGEAAALLQEHARVCRTGGRVIVSVPNGLDLPHRLYRGWMGASYRYHPERSYTPGALARELRKAGLSPVAADGYAPLWSLRQHRVGYIVIAVLHKAGLLARIDGLAEPGLLSRVGSLTVQVAVKAGATR